MNGAHEYTVLATSLDAGTRSRASSILLLGSLLLGLSKLGLAVVILDLMECGGDSVEQTGRDVNNCF